MDASEFVREVPLRDRRVSHAALAAASATVNPAHRKRMGCGDVARRRAMRHVRKHRIRKPLWPLIAAIILVGLIFERRPLPAFSWAGNRPQSDDEGAASTSGPDGGRCIDGLPDPADTGGVEGEPQHRYRPSAQFLSKDISQVVAFLIRNRGKLDTPVVRAKWDHVDRLSLPLAIYLREIEATDTWADLEKEISAAPPDAPFMSEAEMPKSMRHRKILQLLPEWSRCCEELLSLVSADDAALGSAPTPPDGDDGPSGDDDAPPKGPSSR